ncbi:MAG: DNA primase [Thiobacillus sp. 63-78]|uniref:DNA primase n=1 Tax=Thiobacillus sp. 63-78 TaxID=1895859 RepID=UPI000969913C|nr:DNA primase [Thiobacillus sp. 63-78]MBN8762578.1 DNA primase [Thiobacillus sp.]MBN8774021.1 DNA primase [Thiobacillus sp.]OJZ15814.1 MAG: DNA primase [Thiobacillus sp. 63-78]
MIPRDFIDTLLARVDIVDVIDRRVPLKKAGQNYQACCPFHSEKTPSFTVSPTKQFYHCFGCGAHGTALGFLMEYEHMGFPDAVASLAQDAGLQMPETALEPERPKPPPALWDALGQAAQFYKQQLKQTPRAIDYLKRRGLTGTIAARYGIGYAPDGSPLKQVFADYAADALAASGLVVDGDHRRYDRFRDRIMFPIRNVKGQIIGFGGRVLDQGEPKYLNSPETPLFHKGSEIYGLFEARAAIKAAGRAIVVEGYMDVVALAQHGVEFAVATLGTATTPIHARVLLRHTDRLIYAFDGDNAGRKAAWRALENTLEALQDGKEVSFLFLPEGEDPDSYIRSHGHDVFLRLLDDATLPLSAFLVRELARNRRLDSQEGRASLIKDARPLLEKIAAPVLASLIRRHLAELLHLQADELGHLGVKPATRRHVTAPLPQRRPAPSLLRNFACILLMNPLRAGEVEPQWLDTEDPLGHRVSELIVWLREVGALNPQTLTQAAQGGPLESLVNELMADFLDKDENWDWNTEFDDAVMKIRDNWRRRREESLRNRPLNSLSDMERNELIQLLARS